jgi:hypothetical protein
MITAFLIKLHQTAHRGLTRDNAPASVSSRPAGRPSQGVRVDRDMKCYTAGHVVSTSHHFAVKLTEPTRFTGRHCRPRPNHGRPAVQPRKIRGRTAGRCDAQEEPGFRATDEKHLRRAVPGRRRESPAIPHRSGRNDLVRSCWGGVRSPCTRSAAPAHGGCPAWSCAASAATTRPDLCQGTLLPIYHYHTVFTGSSFALVPAQNPAHWPSSGHLIDEHRAWTHCICVATPGLGGFASQSGVHFRATPRPMTARTAETQGD